LRSRYFGKWENREEERIEGICFCKKEVFVENRKQK